MLSGLTSGRRGNSLPSSGSLLQRARQHAVRSSIDMVRHLLNWGRASTACFFEQFLGNSVVCSERLSRAEDRFGEAG